MERAEDKQRRKRRARLGKKSLYAAMNDDDGDGSSGDDAHLDDQLAFLASGKEPAAKILRHYDEEEIDRQEWEKKIEKIGAGGRLRSEKDRRQQEADEVRKRLQAAAANSNMKLYSLSNKEPDRAEMPDYAAVKKKKAKNKNKKKSKKEKQKQKSSHGDDSKSTSVDQQLGGKRRREAGGKLFKKKRKRSLLGNVLKKSTTMSLADELELEVLKGESEKARKTP